MWKARPEENRTTLTPSQPVRPASSLPAANPNVAPLSREIQPHSDFGHIGKSVVLRGELTGNEDLFLDGDVEGTIDLRDHKLVIGPHGKIKATVMAREVVLQGSLDGDIVASERVELKRGCTLTGDVTTQRIAIEDGAFFKGAIDVADSKKHEPAHEPAKDHEPPAEPRKVMAAAASVGATAGSVLGTAASAAKPTTAAALSASAGGQDSFSERT